MTTTKTTLLNFAKKYWFGHDMFNCFNYGILKPFAYQTNLLKMFEQNDKVLINQSRQMGLTSLLALYTSWKLITNPDFKILYISNNLHSGKKFLELVRKIISNYIEKTKINFKILIDNQKKISFENHSYVTIVSHNLQAWKGKSIDLVIFDNAAFIKELNSIYASIVPCLEYKKGQMIINSCSVYYSEFNILAQEIKSGINKHIHYEQIHWTKHPIFGKNKKLVKKSDAEYFIEETKYTNEWYRDVKRHISDDIDRINQELNCKLIIGRNQK